MRVCACVCVCCVCVSVCVCVCVCTCAVISLVDLFHRPMDLTSIKKNVEGGVIRTDIEFQRDILLMFQNALMYNSSDHDV